MDDNINDQLRPYLLQPSSQSIDSILNSINSKIEAIDRLSHTGGIRVTETRSVSGVALQVERQLLHARLQEKANNIALAEEHIWEIWADWQGLVWEGQVDYPHGYDVRDTIAELQSLKLAREIQPVGEEVNKEIDRRVAELVVSDPDRLEMVLDKMDAPVDPDGPAQGKMGEDEMEHPTLTQETWREHTRGMLDEGYTLAEIEALHPELTQLMLEDNVNRTTE